MADMTIANTILAQYGGNQFRVLTGAKNFVGDTNSLSFHLPANAKKCITYVKTTLLPSDTYKVEFINARITVNGPKHEVVSTYENVYCDQLQDIFESETGLYVTLFSRR